MYKTSEERRSATKERVQRHRERWQEQRAHWRAEREAKESVSLPRSTGLLGSVGAAYKYLLQAGKEPTVEAITEFLKWKGAQVEIILALSELQSAGTWTESARKFSAPDIHGQVAEAAMISSLDKEEGWPMGPRHQPAVYELQFGGRNIPGKNRGRKPAALSATSKSSVSVRASHLVCGNAATIAPP
jgi:hypothetical protein